MEVGEQANLIVSPRFGYGSLGLEPNIPPDSTMHYDVELLEVKYGPSVSELSLNQRINTGNRKKDRGNWWYMRGEYSFAIQCYRRALEYFDDTDLPSLNTEEEVHILLEERLKTYNNLAAAQLKIKAHNAALISLEHVLTCQPSNVKALYRKAKILKEQGELESSVKCIREALSVEPNSQSLLQELSTLLATQKEENSKRRDLYKKMFRNTRDSEKTEGETQDNGNVSNCSFCYSFSS
ncbi:hypothetical protein AAG570_012840 [Ranatra chinensis]|uniref:peptidylprolyl isomerase n=1 Tax=Ranatra chinensis TaxID=642074 RepID=A0ABD0YF07_9HEMI